MKGIGTNKIGKLEAILTKYWGREVHTAITTLQNEKLALLKTHQAGDNPDSALQIILHPLGQLIKGHRVTGRAAGLPYYAGIPGPDDPLTKRGIFVVWISYGGKLDALLTPKRIPSILDKLERFRPEKVEAIPEISPQEALLFYTDFVPVKALGSIASEDHEGQVERWEKSNSFGADKSKNPLFQGGLKGTKITVYYAGEKVAIDKQIKYPKTAGELRSYLQAAFGREAYSVLLGLAYLQHQAGRETFTLNTAALCKLIYGPKYAAGTKEMLTETINALQYSQVTLTQPHNGGTIEHVFTPLLVSQIHRKKEGAIPSEIRLTLWPQDQGKQPFKRVAIPANIFNIRINDFALMAYLLVESKHARPGYSIKADLGKTMQAAGLAATFKSNDRVAKARLKERINRLASIGVFGAFEGYESGYLLLKPVEATGQIEAQSDTSRPESN